MRKYLGVLAGVAALCVASSALAGETETLYLTGKGKEDTVSIEPQGYIHIEAHSRRIEHSVGLLAAVWCIVK